MALLAAVAAIAAPGPVEAARPRPLADVVLVVDTSRSMAEPGMDPERTSLLVSKLFTDIVPGHLAVVRTLDLMQDNDLLPSRNTGRTIPCAEDPSQTCNEVEPAKDWQANARQGIYGTLIRPRLGDAGFKKQLESHLQQASNNSLFYLAFRAAQGVFDRHGPADHDTRRTVIWLSDGRTENPQSLHQVARKLQQDSVKIEAIVFGRGDPSLPRQVGLEVRQTSNPAELMAAFAGAFRRIIKAPYEIDHRVTTQPSFLMKAHIAESWVVVYGEDSLGDVELEGPTATVAANDAAERWPGAGAYRVAHLTNPAEGTWTVRAEGGGPDVAYAVVQWSALHPVFLGPESTLAGIETELQVEVRSATTDRRITDPEVLNGLQITAELEGHRVSLVDDDGDGSFTGIHRFTGQGEVLVQVRLLGGIVDRTVEASVEVSGSFRFNGEPLRVDFGALTAGDTVCRPLTIPAEHNGEVPFELRTPPSLPRSHRLEARLPAGTLAANGDPLPASPGTPFELCLVTGRSAPSSTVRSEPGSELVALGGTEASHHVPLRLSWQVTRLSFWERWGKILLWLLLVLILLLVILGFVLPHRFQRGLSVALATEREELEEQMPAPLKVFKGTGVGFYRSARAFLQGDFRFSGNSRGALAGLLAEKRMARVIPRGSVLFRQALDGDWEQVVDEGRKVRSGDVYRVGDTGPYFRISTRGGA